MAGGQERILRRRIKTVESTKKITKAMELIAASRIVKAQARVTAARPYAEKITEVLRNLASGGAGVDHPLLAKLWGPLIGPLVAVISFVCSVGNIPLAAVLWNGGISFGGAIAFIFADLIILPILNIYRKYYGWKMAAFLFATFYAAMAGAALIVELIFDALGLVPAARNARVVDASISWNYTTWLNIAFLVLAGLLVWRFFTTGGLAMLRMMNKPAATGHSH